MTVLAQAEFGQGEPGGEDNLDTGSSGRQGSYARYVLSRCFGALGSLAFMLLVFAPRSGLKLLRSTRLPLQLTRSSLHCLSAILTFYALGFVALPTATAISFSAPLMVTALAPVVLGERVGFNYGCYVNGYGGLRIGHRTIVGPYAMIHTANHQTAAEQPIVEQTWTKEPVEIGNDCWIGMGACILPVARLGDGCVVGGGSVVVGELEPNCIAVGNPARVIKHR